MDWLTRFGLSRTRLTILIMAGLLVQGVLQYMSFPKREDPAITIRNVIVKAELPGLSPERIESLLAIPIERKAREIGEIDDIKTRVLAGAAVVNPEVSNATPSDQLTTVFQNIRNKMSALKSELPEGTKGPSVNTEYGAVALATVAVTGEGFSLSEIEESAKNLQTRLYEVEGIAKASLLGVQEEHIWLEFDSSKLAAIGVQVRQLVLDLQEQNVVLPAGELDAGGTLLVLEANGDLGSVEDIKQLITKVPGLAGFVRLGDVLNVRRGYPDPKDKPAYFNNEPAVMVAIEMLDGFDAQQLGRKIKSVVSEHENTQAIGISYRFSTYQESKVTVAVNSALSNVGMTFGVVLVLMFLFMGFRPALVIAAIVPFSVMFAILGMGQIGIDLEQVSIAAVIISLGLLVDNGLVIVEDIKGKISRGVAPRDAAASSGKQFFLPLLVASITTVSSFLPMMILNGTEGEYAFSLGAVVALMLLGSWLSAMYILPSLCVWFLKPASTPINAPPNRLQRLYQQTLGHLFKYSIAVIVIGYGLVFTSVTHFMPQLKSEMFPLSERDQFLIYMDMPKGTSLSATESVAQKVNEWLLDNKVNPEIVNTTLYIADGGPRFYLSLNPADGSPSNAFFLVNTKDFSGALNAANRAQRYLYTNHPEARFKLKRLSMGGSESGIVEIKVSGTDGDQLLKLADRIEAGFSSAPGIVQNENDWGTKVFQVEIDIAQDKAREIGVTSQSLSEILDAYFNGSQISTFRDNDKTIPISLRANETFRDSLDDLASISIPVNGQPVSLSQFAQITPRLEFSQIRRENQKRVITVTAKSETLSAQEIFDHIRPTLNQLELPPGYSYAIDGEIAKSADVYGKLASGLPVALMVMLIALTFQFNSARKVILTFATIPLVIVGAPVALWLTDKPMSFFATLGLISLAGIIINNAIVLIDQIDIERKTKELQQAITDAAAKRFSPIMLTSFTTVFGLIPMAITGGALWEPMATLMIGGLVVASAATLLFVPMGYYLMFRAWNRLKRTQP